MEVDRSGSSFGEVLDFNFGCYRVRVFKVWIQRDVVLGPYLCIICFSFIQL